MQFSGKHRFDEETGKVELDYPRDMSMWKGVPYNIDAVFQHTNGKALNKKYYEYFAYNDEYRLFSVRKNIFFQRQSFLGV